MPQPQSEIRTTEVSEFIRTHCQTCAAGWTRTGEQGWILTVCLLDRNSVPPDMTSCDRFEPLRSTRSNSA